MIISSPYNSSTVPYTGKAKGLIDLYQNGFNIPRFVMLEEEFFKYYSSNGCFNEEAMNKVWQESCRWNSKSIVARSSMSYEDQNNYSCAGIGKTHLHITNLDQLELSLIDIYKKSESGNIDFYSKKMGIKGPNSLSIIVQEQIFPLFSGVLFTCNPINFDPSQLEIEVAYSDAANTVEGRWQERITVDKITKEIRSHNLRITNPILTMEILHSIIDNVRTIEKKIGKNQDIEWAVTGDNGMMKFYFLQLRRITTINNNRGE